tara:strand:- start:484 stop:651 length:168 start_codon:yes stop_codon:yes gene_type:complete
MIKKILNWIKNIFKPERQDKNLILHEEKKEEKKIEHCYRHLRFIKGCLDCRKVVK